MQMLLIFRVIWGDKSVHTDITKKQVLYTRAHSLLVTGNLPVTHSDLTPVVTGCLLSCHMHLFINDWTPGEYSDPGLMLSSLEHYWPEGKFRKNINESRGV